MHDSYNCSGFWTRQKQKNVRRRERRQKEGCGKDQKISRGKQKDVECVEKKKVKPDWDEGGNLFGN